MYLFWYMSWCGNHHWYTFLVGFYELGMCPHQWRAFFFILLFFLALQAVLGLSWIYLVIIPISAIKWALLPFIENYIQNPSSRRDVVTDISSCLEQLNARKYICKSVYHTLCILIPMCLYNILNIKIHINKSDCNLVCAILPSCP